MRFLIGAFAKDFALEISGGIATLITYLKESDLKGYKFKEPEIPYGLFES